MALILRDDVVCQIRLLMMSGSILRDDEWVNSKGR